MKVSGVGLQTEFFDLHSLLFRLVKFFPSVLLSNDTGIPPSLIFKKFVELRGVELVAQYIEAVRIYFL